MADIVINEDNSLSLKLSEEERATFNFLPQGQLASYVTIWLKERFTNVWKDTIAKLTSEQKQELLTLLSAESEPVPAEEVKA